MFAELGDRHLRQQRLGRNAALHQMRGRGRLAHAGAAAGAGVAGPHGLDDAVLGRRHVETAGTILADPAIRPHPHGQSRISGSTTCSMRGRWAGKRGRRGSICGPGRTCRRDAPVRSPFLDFGDRDLDLFQNKLHLVGIELLRALAETRTLVLLHE